MGINLATNFTVGSPLPLDDRDQVADLTARDAIPAGRRWQGMVVHVLADGKNYQLVGGIANANWAVQGASADAVTQPTAGPVVDGSIPVMDGTTGKVLKPTDLSYVGGLISKLTAGDLEFTTLNTNESLIMRRDVQIRRRLVKAGNFETATGANVTLTLPTTSVIHLTNAGLTSIADIPDAPSGTELTITSRIGTPVTIRNNARIQTGTGADLILGAGQVMTLMWSESAPWKVISRPYNAPAEAVKVDTRSNLITWALTAGEGKLGYATDDDKLYVVNGTVIQDAAIKSATKAALTTYALAATNGQLVFATDEKKMYQVVDGGLQTFGTAAGQGSKNYIINYNAESDASGWTVYDDGAVTRPVDGVGGTPAILPPTRNTAQPLSGTGDFVFTKPASNCRGQGWKTVAFTIDNEDVINIIRNGFSYKVSAGYTDGAVQIFMKNETSGEIIDVSRPAIDANALVGRYVSSWQTQSATSYSLILHIVDNSSTAWSLNLDSLVVGPQVLTYGQVVATQDTFLAQTATFGAVDITGALTSSTRNGTLYSYNSANGVYTALKEISVSVSIAFSNAAGAVTQPTITRSGVAYGLASSSTVAGNWMTASSSFILQPGQTFVVTNGGPGSTNAQRITVSAVYVSQNMVLSEDFGSRDVSLFAKGNGGQAITANVTDIPFGGITIAGVTHDTTTSWSGTQYTVPETGRYDFRAKIDSTTAVSASIGIWINGAAVGIFDNQGSGAGAFFHSFDASNIPLYKGQVVSLRSTVGMTLANNQGIHRLSISKRASPQTLAGGTKVSVRAVQSSGQTIAHSTPTIVVWDAIKTYDTHNAFNPATGEFTAPVSGRYRVGPSLLWSNASTWASAGNESAINFLKNGSIYSVPYDDAIKVTAAVYSRLGYPDTVPLLAGEKLSIQVSQLSGSNKSFIADARYNFVTIDLV